MKLTPVQEPAPKNRGGAKPWRLRLIPIGLFGVPIFLVLSSVVISPFRYLFGPVNVFNVTRGTISPEEIAGVYQVSAETNDRASRRGVYLSADSGLRLELDHTVRVLGLPAFDSGGTPQDCHFSATGTWTEVQHDGETRLLVTLTMASPPAVGEPVSCGLERLELRMLGHRAPYRLWYETGDGDEGSALVYQRQ